MKNILVILSISCSALAFSAKIDVIKELKELNLHYLQMDEFQLDFEIGYYNWNGQPIMSKKGTVIHTNKLHYINLSGNITLIENDQFISVNREFKTMLHSSWEQSQQKGNDPSMDLGQFVDSLWQNQTSIQYEILQVNNGQLRVGFESEESHYFNYYEILVDTKKDQILEFKYNLSPNYYNQNDPVAKIVVKYTGESQKVKARQPFLKMDYYIRKSGDQLQPSKEFTGYELIDQNEISQ